MNVELDGTAVVTGAGRGIGAALAIALATAGMRVGLIGRTGAALAGTAANCPRETVCAVADVADEAELVAALTSVQDRFGPVDLLVNNAAIADATECLLWTVDAGSWWSVVETNLRGPFLACRLTLPGMVRRGQGRVVNINTGMGMRPSTRYSAYSASKAGLARLTSCLAESAREYGVAVSTSRPATSAPG